MKTLNYQVSEAISIEDSRRNGVDTHVLAGRRVCGFFIHTEEIIFFVTFFLSETCSY